MSARRAVPGSVADAARLCARVAGIASASDIPMLPFDRDWLRRDGTGVTIGLIDCAIDLRCPDLAQANIVARDFVGSADLSPANGAHGTAIARLLVGQGRRAMRGVVPRARLYAARVVGPGDTAMPVRVAAALDWLRDLQVCVLAMPIGSEHGDPLLNAVLDRSIAAGVRIFAPGGSGAGAILYPARHTGVIAVGPCDEKGRLAADARARPHLHMLAPGIAVAGAAADGGAASGSSIAATLAAGAAALGAAYGP